MTTYSLDAESFISEIKKYRELWDVGSDGNRYKAKDKQIAWANVARVFIPDFETMKEIEKTEVYRKLHSKWRNIRDAYVRNLKRKDGKRGYMYARHLTFLNSRYTSNQTSEDETTDDEKHLDINKSRTIEVTTNSDEENSTIINLKRRRNERNDNIEFVDTPNISSIDTNNYCTEDEDRSFFDSLLPAVREFDLDQKLEFRCEVLKLLKHIRSQCNGYKPDFNAIAYVD